MIFYLCVRRNTGPVVQLLRTVWPDQRALRFQVILYEESAYLEIEAGLYIFSDIELMDDAMRVRAQALHDLVRAREDCVVWNNPARSSRRFELLEHLWKTGVNAFRAYRASEPLPAEVRYPVFVRQEHEHTGSLTPLLRSALAVQEMIAWLHATSKPAGPLLVVEFLDYASADGAYRKYSFFRLGPRLIPKHLLFSTDWVLKEPVKGRFDTPEWLDEEWRFLHSQEHGQQIMEIFESLALDYGRIDYTIVNGRVQVFEINSNPTVIKPTHLDPIPRRRVHVWFIEQFLQVLEEVDPGRRASALKRFWWRINRPKLGRAHWIERLAVVLDRLFKRDKTK